MKPITLERGESILAVVPQFANGPGWSNRPLWVYIKRNDGKLREECIQPEQQTSEMHALFSPGAAMCSALAACVPTKRKKEPQS